MSGLGVTLPDDLLALEAWERLSTVYDPELGVNLVDLGLVYAVQVEDGAASVLMTLTTPGCPLSDSMPDAVERALLSIPGIARASVDLVWEPRWTPERMTARAKRELGWISTEV